MREFLVFASIVAAGACGDSSAPNALKEVRTSGQFDSNGGTEQSRGQEETSTPAEESDVRDSAGDVPTTHDSATDVNSSEDGSGRQRQSAASSKQPCMCWPNGDLCDLESSAPPRGPNPEFRCPEEEVCMGSLTNQFTEVLGMCARPCWHPDATHTVDLDCIVGEECRVKPFHWGFEQQYSAVQAYCVKILPQGDPQPSGDPKQER